MGGDGGPQLGPDGKAPKPPGMEHFSEEELAEFGKQLAKGEMPKELQGLFGGNPGAGQIPN